MSPLTYQETLKCIARLLTYRVMYARSSDETYFALAQDLLSGGQIPSPLEEGTHSESDEGMGTEPL